MTIELFTAFLFVVLAALIAERYALKDLLTSQEKQTEYWFRAYMDKMTQVTEEDFMS